MFHERRVHSILAVVKYDNTFETVEREEQWLPSWYINDSVKPHKLPKG